MWLVFSNTNAPDSCRDVFKKVMNATGILQGITPLLSIQAALRLLICIEDLKQNLIYREDCIKKDYLTWTLATAIPSAILCLVNLFGGNHWAIYLFVLFTGGFYSMISLIKLLHHQVICKREFEAFLKQ